MAAAALRLLNFSYSYSSARLYPTKVLNEKILCVGAPLLRPSMPWANWVGRELGEISDLIPRRYTRLFHLE